MCSIKNACYAACATASAMLREPLPVARLVTRTEVREAPGHSLATTDLATAALVFEPVELPGGEAGEAELVTRTNAVLRIRTRAPTRQLLVVSESFRKGWNAGGQRAARTPDPGLRRFHGVCGARGGQRGHAAIRTQKPAPGQAAFPRRASPAAALRRRLDLHPSPDYRMQRRRHFSLKESCHGEARQS